MHLTTAASNHSSSAQQCDPELGLTLLDIGFLSAQITPAALGYLPLLSEGLAVRGKRPWDRLHRETNSQPRRRGRASDCALEVHVPPVL